MTVLEPKYLEVGGVSTVPFQTFIYKNFRCSSCVVHFSRHEERLKRLAVVLRYSKGLEFFQISLRQCVNQSSAKTEK